MKNSQKRAMRISPWDLADWLRYGRSGKVEKVDILQAGVNGAETIAGRAVGVNTNFVLAGDQMTGDGPKLRFQRAQLVIVDHNLRPNFVLQGMKGFLRSTFEQQLPGGD